MADIFWPRADLVTRLLLACVASVSVRFRSKERGTRVKDRAKSGVSKRAGRGWGRKEGNFLPSPASPPSFVFLLSFHFSRGQKRNSHSSVFLYSETKRKRLLCRLDFSHTPILPISWEFMPQKVVHRGWKTCHVYPVGKPYTAVNTLIFWIFLDLWWGLLYSAQISGRLKGNSQR